MQLIDIGAPFIILSALRRIYFIGTGIRLNLLLYLLRLQKYAWSDKYRPRKPRFFNRVHTVSGYHVFE